MGLNTINHNALNLLLDEMSNLQALQHKMDHKIELISKLVDEIEKVIDHQEKEIDEMQREIYIFNRAG